MLIERIVIILFPKVREIRTKIERASLASAAPKVRIIKQINSSMLEEDLIYRGHKIARSRIDASKASKVINRWVRWEIKV